MALLLAACGEDGTSGGGRNDGAPAGTLRIGAGVALDTFDPHALAVGAAQIFLRPIYDSLLVTDENGGLVEGEGVAEQVEQEEGLLRVHLRDDVVFSDGAKLDADVVRQNLERAAETNGYGAGVLSNVDVTVVDPLTVELRTDEPMSVVIYALAGNPGMLISPDALDDPSLAENPVGSGPWMLDPAGSREGDRYTFESNPHSWDAEGQTVETIVISELIDAAARTNALAAGELDMALLGGAQAKQLVDQGFDAVGVTNRFFAFVIQDREGTIVEPLGDERVRRALAKAVDRDAFVENVLLGFGEANAQWYPQDHWAHDPSIDDDLAYDPDGARALLDEAGYGDGFEFEAIVNSINKTQAEAVAGYFADIGVTMNLQLEERAAFVDGALSGKFPMVITTTGTNVVVPEVMYLDWFAPGIRYNVHGIVDEQLDGTYAQAAAETDSEARAALWQEMAQHALVDAAYMIVPSTHQTLAITTEDVKGVTFSADVGPYLRGITVG